MTPDDDDFLDGICDLAAPMAAPTEDGTQTIALVLFADIDFTDPRAVAERRVDWEILFPTEKG
jgi:hypothetical protein